jgi:hypothetical protein
MSLIPLLPQTKGEEWPPQEDGGIHSISDLDYQRNLCENYYEASDFGTPSPLAWCIVFKQRLEKYAENTRNNIWGQFDDIFELWSIFLKGIYFGLISFRRINLDDLRELGQIIKAEMPKEFRFNLLSYKNITIGFTYPDIGFVPSVRLSQVMIDELKLEIAKKDIEKASEYFVGWVRTFDNKDHQDILFYALLYQLANRWNSTVDKSIEINLDLLFEQGPKLWLMEGEDNLDITQPILRVYVGTPIICAKCSHQMRSLEIRSPDDCRCPNCRAKQDWLQQYSSWIRFSLTRGCYLIYAFENSPVRELPYSNYVTYEADGIVIQTGQVNLKVFGLILSEDALRCTRLVFFNDGESTRMPDLPIRGEYFGLVKLAEMDHNPGIDRLTKEYIANLRVEGWEETITIRYPENVIEYEEALLLSWPNFKLKDWNIYYYLLESIPTLNKAGLSLRALAENAQPKLLNANRGQITQNVDAFEIVFSKDGKIDKQAGIYSLSKYSIRRGETPLTIALDFGTSSSSVYYKLGDGPEEILRYEDFTETIIENSKLSDNVLRYSDWLPTYRINDVKTAWQFYRDQLDSFDNMPSDPQEIIDRLNYSIPSELIAATPISAESLEYPLTGYRICHPYAARPDGEVIYEAKTMDVKGDDKARYSYEQVVSRYIETVLVIALASIARKEERTGYLIVRASFPRTFDSDKIRLYLICLNKILKKVESYTGFVTNSTYYIDESKAAAYSMPVKGGLALVMDMGGGTTDICIFERKEDKLEPLFIESLLYGGNAYLRLLADKGSLFPKPSEKFDNRLLWLLREIRLRGFDTVVRTQYRGNTHSRDLALDLLLQFYSPIAYFVSLMFDALSIYRNEKKDYKKEEITYYLAGNGWTLADAMSPIDSNYTKGYKEIIRYLLEKYGFNRLVAASEPIFDDKDSKWPGPKASIGFGTIMAKEKDLYQTIDEAASDQNGIRSIVGFDIHIDDGSNNLTPIAWHEKIPTILNSTYHKPVLSDLSFPKDWNFIEYVKGKQVSALEQRCAKDVIAAERPIFSRSVMTRFIENMYLKQLDRARRI